MFSRPTTCAEAVRILASEGGVLIAGGTDVFPALVDRPTPTRLIDLTACADLKGITVTERHTRIAGGVTWSQIARAELPRGFHALKSAAREVGSIQIQNRATLAGNLCNASPAADGLPPLLAMDAELELTGPNGVRTLPIGEFVLGNRHTARRPDEILSTILIPRTCDRAGSSFVKLGTRQYMIISIVMVAVTLVPASDGSIGSARVAVGAASSVARRLNAIEQRLVGADPGPNSAASYISDGDLGLLTPIDDVRASAAYRLEAARELIVRAIVEAWERARA
jgi:CO/xanthine dehydrogenase FAD-binding subunit